MAHRILRIGSAPRFVCALTSTTRAAQDDAVRPLSEVLATGDAVVAAYADKTKAQNGILDVTKAPYSADPTGNIDSTAAIQKAMKDARDARLVTYLPAGTYRVPKT